METDSEYDREEKTLSDSSKEAHVPRKTHKGGRSSGRSLPLLQNYFLALLL